MQCLNLGFYPVQAPIQLRIVWRGKLSLSEWPEIISRHRVDSLRQLAMHYGVSHESMRRTLVAARNKTTLQHAE